MGFVKNLLGKIKRKKDGKIEESEIEKELNYNEKLIEDFKNDHAELLGFFPQVEESFNTDRNAHKKITDLLNDFKVALEIHVMVEDNKLYTFLKEKYGTDETHKAFVEDIQSEMTNITKEAIFFNRKYTNRQSYDNNIDNFLKDLGNIKDMLVKRFKMEEDRLYSLYSN
jgi:hemerythrin-like domain-containing protein